MRVCNVGIPVCLFANGRSRDPWSYGEFIIRIGLLFVHIADGEHRMLPVRDAACLSWTIPLLQTVLQRR